MVQVTAFYRGWLYNAVEMAFGQRRLDAYRYVTYRADLELPAVPQAGDFLQIEDGLMTRVESRIFDTNTGKVGLHLAQLHSIKDGDHEVTAALQQSERWVEVVTADRR